MKNTSATGYHRWLTLFEKELNEPKPEHYYFAEMSAELASIPFLVWGKMPPPELRDSKTFMLKFGTAEEIEKMKKEVAEKRAAQDAELSQSVWTGLFGLSIGPDGKPVKQEKPPTSSTKRELPPHVIQATQA